MIDPSSDEIGQEFKKAKPSETRLAARRQCTVFFGYQDLQK